MVLGAEMNIKAATLGHLSKFGHLKALRRSEALKTVIKTATKTVTCKYIIIIYLSLRCLRRSKLCVYTANHVPKTVRTPGYLRGHLRHGGAEKYNLINRGSPHLDAHGNRLTPLLSGRSGGLMGWISGIQEDMTTFSPTCSPLLMRAYSRLTD